jgi:predicted transport protein
LIKKLEAVSLKKHPKLNEKWVQEQIAADPTLLGLGDVEVKDIERRQPGAGRLDLLLYDTETLKRYEVEIQLGATDESHLIRTIEYWDVERRRYPQYEHTAVIVAEEITSRFLNVIHLFNGHIPLIALKMTAYQVGDEVALTFVKVLDEVSLGLVDEDEPVAEARDRPYWEAKASKATLALTDDLLNKVVKAVEPGAALKYNKNYIGLVIDGAAFNFVSFVPKKAHLILSFRLERSEEVDAALDEAGLVKLAYDAQFRQYRVRIDASLKDQGRDVLIDMAQHARASFGKLA